MIMTPFVGVLPFAVKCKRVCVCICLHLEGWCGTWHVALTMWNIS